MPLRQKHLFTLQASLFFVLLLALIVQAGRVLGHQHWAKFDLTGNDVGTLKDDTRAFLSTFGGKIAFTYFVTPSPQMPSHLKSVVTPVTTLLQTLQQTAPTQISYRIIDPDLSGETGHNYAARKKASPFSVRRIKQDEHSEQDVWSSLVIAPEGHKEILIQKITPEDVAFLENLILKHLQSLQTPPKPTIAISSPNYVTLFTQFANQYGTVKQVDLRNAQDFPFDADMLFWLEPQQITQTHIYALQRFIQAGKTVVLGGSTHVIDYTTNDANQIVYQAFPTGSGWQNLLAPFGIRPQPDLLLDESQGPIFFRDQNNQVRQADAPFHLRVMPGFYNLKGFLSHARGALNFVSASPLDIEPRKVSEAGFQVDVLATTTEKTSVTALPSEPFTQSQIQNTLPVGKQNVMLRLVSENPWHGEMLILGTTSPFRDGIFNQPNYGHRVFLQTVLRTFTERSRIVKGRVTRPQPPALPTLSGTTRLFWRLAVVFCVPLLLIGLGTRRYLARGDALVLRGVGNLPLRLALGVVFILLASRMWTWEGNVFWDLTAENIHTPKAFTQSKLKDKQLKADLILPPRAKLPSQLKHIEQRVATQLNTLNIPLTIRRPETLSAQDRARLQTAGLQPFEVQNVQDDQQISQWIFSGLLIHKPGGATVIPRLDDRTIDHLEFHLLTAENRLSSGQIPHIALISEPPRLSPAEAFEYHQQQLTPPKGADVFSEVQSLLKTYGYRVTYVNPRAPVIPTDTDVILWMQPRRDATQITQLFSQHLANGGKGLVALQHFNIQQRQYRGGGFETVYWPQPQYQDLNAYLDHLGLTQVREVLMDQTKSRLSLETQINRAAVREYEAQEVTLPFLIRAVGPNFLPSSPITQQLGDQLFIWGNRFTVGEDSLKKYGLTAQALINTSPNAWAYDWRGGWMPEPVFSPTDSLRVGQQPLAVLTEGTFPRITISQDDSGRVVHHLAKSPINKPSEMILLGSSEMFKNDYVYAPNFQHEQLLLNSISYLTWGKDYTQIQARRKIARGFAYQPSGQKAFWRIGVISTGTALFLLYGLFRFYSQKRISTRY